MDETLVSTETTHSRDTLLSNIQQSVLIFLLFFVLFDFGVFNPPNLNCFSTSIFFAIYYTFCFKSLWHVNF